MDSDDPQAFCLRGGFWQISLPLFQGSLVWAASILHFNIPVMLIRNNCMLAIASEQDLAVHQINPLGPRQPRTTMKNKLEKYVGRIVRLNQEAFQELCRRARHQSEEFENRFLVAEVGRGMHKLVCYGANLRIIVGVSDVALV